MNRHEADLGYIADAFERVMDALEGLVTSHLGNDDGSIEHWGMAVNMDACDVLVLYRPDRWRATEGGIERTPT